LPFVDSRPPQFKRSAILNQIAIRDFFCTNVTNSFATVALGPNKWSFNHSFKEQTTCTCLHEPLVVGILKLPAVED